MASPASEIVVSNEPLPSSPAEANNPPTSPELSPPPAIIVPPVDPNSKKSFKRKYRKLLRKYRQIRATNEYLHTAYSKATIISTQLSNENANVLDFLVGLDQRIPSKDTTAMDVIEDLPPASPSEFNYDPHHGYSPTPSPPPEIANQLTQEQIDMGMIKVEPGSGGLLGTMGPPQPVIREESVDTSFKSKRPSQRPSGQPVVSGRKRKDRDSDGEENTGSIVRKKTRG